VDKAITEGKAKIKPLDPVIDDIVVNFHFLN